MFWVHFTWVVGGPFIILFCYIVHINQKYAARAAVRRQQHAARMAELHAEHEAIKQKMKEYQ